MHSPAEVRVANHNRKSYPQPPRRVSGNGQITSSLWFQVQFFFVGWALAVEASSVNGGILRGTGPCGLRR